MHFSAPILMALAALSNAAAIPESTSTTSVNATISEVGVATLGGATVEIDVNDSAELEKRGSFATIQDRTGGDAGLAIGKILNHVLQQLFPLKDWTKARETFTQATTLNMWNANPHPGKWVAVACYNKGWNVKNRAGISDVVSMGLHLGELHTDYDCMYIGRYNQFYTNSEGGYINLAYRYNSNICAFDGKTGDLTCN